MEEVPYQTKDEILFLPTVSLEAQLATPVIDVHGKRDVAIVDIPGSCYYIMGEYYLETKRKHLYTQMKIKIVM